MVDITQYPYFSYGPQIELLMHPLKGLAAVELLGFSRMYKNRQRFLVCHHHDWAIDFYSNELYRYGLYEKEPKHLPSAYHMWDHLPYSPPEVYNNTRRKFDLAHGLIIVKQYESYSDTFVFGTYTSNSLINNFYLNQKELFEQFIADFYEMLAPDLDNLVKHRFCVLGDFSRKEKRIVQLSKRQRECALLISEGYNTKEVAKLLKLSPRTVESHLDDLREKFEVKNRVQLCSVIKNFV